jgi:xylan 1,4-beta-xylosidase
LRVGGPATAQAAWADRFIAHCVSNNVPVDFVSTHAYANDTPEDLFGTHEPILRRDMLPRAARKVFDEVKASARPGLPVIWSEFNASYMNERTVTDSPFMGPWLAETISRTDGLATAMSYWTFSDVFEEKGVVKTPFYGGYGLIAAGGIPKAAFNAFRLLHQLGTERIAVKDRAVLATRRPDGSLVLAVWNYAGPDEAGSSVRLVLSFRNLKGRRGLRIQQVDGEHGSPLGAWKAMGEPAYPTATQLAELRRATELPPPEIRELPVGESPLAAIELKPHALALIEVR